MIPHLFAEGSEEVKGKGLTFFVIIRAFCPGNTIKADSGSWAQATVGSDSHPASSLKAHLTVDVPSDQKIAVTDTSDRNEFPLSAVWV